MDFNHNDPVQMADPYEMYKKLRETCPVAWSEHYGGFWLLTSYDDVRNALRDFETYSSAEGIGLPLPEGYQRSLLQDYDPPLHDEVRRLVEPCFSPQVVQRWEPSIEAIADELIDNFAAKPAVEVVEAFTTPLSTTVLMRHIADISSQEMPTMLQAARRLIRHSPDYDHEEFLGPVARNVARRTKSETGDDVIGALLAGTVQGKPLSDELVVSTAVAIIGAGLSTTSDALSAALYRLAIDPSLRAQLVNDEALIRGAVEEFLRIDSPVQMLRRTATHNHVVRDRELHKGDPVMLCYASANRDPKQFADPDTADLQRQKNAHLTFGAGIHRCVGATVARVTMRIGLIRFLARLPEFRVANAFMPQWTVGQSRGLDRLDLALGTPS